MVTLRSYSSPVEAAMAKSLLDDHQIACSLADENSNLYAGTGQFAIPIRLLLAKEQVEQALHILDDARQPLPDDFDPDKGSSDKGSSGKGTSKPNQTRDSKKQAASA